MQRQYLRPTTKICSTFYYNLPTVLFVIYLLGISFFLYLNNFSSTILTFSTHLALNGEGVEAKPLYKTLCDRNLDDNTETN